MEYFLKIQRNRFRVKAFLELPLVTFSRLHLSPALNPIACRPFVPFSGEEIFLEQTSQQPDRRELPERRQQERREAKLEGRQAAR